MYVHHFNNTRANTYEYLILCYDLYLPEILHIMSLVVLNLFGNLIRQINKFLCQRETKFLIPLYYVLILILYTVYSGSHNTFGRSL